MKSEKITEATLSTQISNIWRNQVDVRLLDNSSIMWFYFLFISWPDKVAQYLFQEGEKSQANQLLHEQLIWRYSLTEYIVVFLDRTIYWASHPHAISKNTLLDGYA